MSHPCFKDNPSRKTNFNLKGIGMGPSLTMFFYFMYVKITVCKSTIFM